MHYWDNSRASIRADLRVRVEETTAEEPLPVKIKAQTTEMSPRFPKKPPHTPEKSFKGAFGCQMLRRIWKCSIVSLGYINSVSYCEDLTGSAVFSSLVQLRSAQQQRSLSSPKKARKPRKKTMTTHDAQLVPSTSSSGGVSPHGGTVACVCAPTRGKRTRGI